MPSTVESLFSAAALTPTGVVPWGIRIPRQEPGMPGTGVYVVALTKETNSTESAIPEYSKSLDALETLLRVRPELTLDGTTPDTAALAERLSLSWCPDEVVLYVGLAGPRKRINVSELSDRAKEYYDTDLGARSPHAGGWPLKTLANLGELFVHFCYCEDVVAAERQMLEAFGESLSQQTRDVLYDRACLVPFANLRGSTGNKALGIKGARAPRDARKTSPPTRSPAPGSASTIAVARTSTHALARVGVSDRTQRITAADIKKGAIRIPRAAKSLFPMEPAELEVNIRGSRKKCRWNPRYGSPERSGVLGIGRQLMASVVAEDEILAIAFDGDVVCLD